MSHNNIDEFKKLKFPVRFFKNDDIKFESNALEELRSLLNLSDTIERIKESDRGFFSSTEAGISEVAITPDSHKGAGIPIGTVMLTDGFIVPQAIGNDIYMKCTIIICYHIKTSKSSLFYPFPFSSSNLVNVLP